MFTATTPMLTGMTLMPAVMEYAKPMNVTGLRLEKIAIAQTDAGPIPKEISTPIELPPNLSGPPRM